MTYCIVNNDIYDGYIIKENVRQRQEMKRASELLCFALDHFADFER